MKHTLYIAGCLGTLALTFAGLALPIAIDDTMVLRDCTNQKWHSAEWKNDFRETVTYLANRDLIIEWQNWENNQWGTCTGNVYCMKSVINHNSKEKMTSSINAITSSINLIDYSGHPLDILSDLGGWEQLTLKTPDQI